MNIRLYNMILIVCIVVAIPSSSFFLTAFLTEKITENNYSKVQFNYALGKDNQSALASAWNNSKVNSKRWFYFARKLAKTDGNAAHQLANYYQKQKLNVQATAWYQRAMRLGFSPAFVALAQLYFEQNKLDKVDNVLSLLSEVQDAPTRVEAKILSIQLAIHRGNIAYVQQELAESKKLIKSTQLGRTLLNNINKYQIIAQQEIQETNTRVSENHHYCANSIQFFSTNLRHLKHIEQLITQFNQQALAKFVCFLPVRYLTIDSLECSSDTSKAISCNELKWQDFAETIDSRFVALLLPEGGANVHLGVLYIDAQDELDVLTHEISHLLGFVDEYPLKKEHIKCQAVQSQPFSENIAVLPAVYQGQRNEVRAQVLAQLSWAEAIKSHTPILKPIKQNQPVNKLLWQLGTPKEFRQEVGVFYAQTCAKAVNQKVKKKVEFIAVKPIYNPTKMQYFSLDFPLSYYENLEKSKGKYVMPSFHYNIALAHYQNGDTQQAQYWLTQSLKWEEREARKNNILQGVF